jgi:hypothetical protein
MKIADIFVGLAGTVGVGLLSFAAMQVYQMNAHMAVVSYKVDENHDMIKPMWQDFLIRKAGMYDNVETTNVVPSIEISKRKN